MFFESFRKSRTQYEFNYTYNYTLNSVQPSQYKTILIDFKLDNTTIYLDSKPAKYFV